MLHRKREDINKRESPYHRLLHHCRSQREIPCKRVMDICGSQEEQHPSHFQSWQNLLEQETYRHLFCQESPEP